MTAATYTDSPGYRRWLLILLTATYTSNFVDRSILGILAQPIKADLGLSDTQIGWLGGLAFAFLYTALAIPLARVAERKSRVVLISICIAVWSIMTAVCGLAQNYVQLFLARVGVGIGEAGCVPASQSLISDHFPVSKRATALAVFSLGIPLGSLTGAVAGGWIAQNLDWRMAFMVVGLPGLLLAILAPLTLREPPRGFADLGRQPPIAPPPFLAVIRTLWSKPSVVLMCTGATLGAMATYGLGVFTAAYFIRRFDLGLAQAGLIVGLVGSVPMIFSNMAGGMVADFIARKDRRGYAWTSVAGMAIATPLFVLGFLQTRMDMAVILMVAAAIFQQMYLAPSFAIANNAVPAQMRATTVALMTFVWALIGMGFGPLIVGMLSDKFGKALAADGGADILGACGAASPTCADPSAAGLAYALIVIVCCYGLGAVFYFLSARTMAKDLDPATM